MKEDEEVEENETNPIVVVVQNPLMIEDILDKIFPYFQHDSKNLCTFRLVNHTWNSSVCRTIKQNLIWRIGAKESRVESGFLRIMSKSNKCADDLFANFRITQTHGTAAISANCVNITKLEKKIQIAEKHIQKLLMSYGSSILHLRLEASQPYFINAYLHKPGLVPNLTSLKLWGLHHGEVFVDSPILLNCQKENDDFIFPTLESISMGRGPPLNSAFWPRSYEGSSYLNLCTLLKAAPACHELEIINYKPATTKLLASLDHGLFLGSLTSFSTLDSGSAPGQQYVILDLAEFKNLTSKCSSLKKLATAIQGEIEEEKVYTELGRLSLGLEELNLERHRNGDDDSDSSSDDDDDDASLTFGSNSDNEMGWSDTDGTDDVDTASSFTSNSTEYDSDDDDDDDASSMDSTQSGLSARVEQGIKRQHDDDDDDSAEEDQDIRKKKVKVDPTNTNTNPPPRTQFPHFTKLNKLTLVGFHLYNDFDVFNNLPALTYLNIKLKSCDSDLWPIVQPTNGNHNVKYFKLRYAGMNQERLSLFAAAFPALTELDVVVPNDTELRTIFASMTGLKRLHLNHSKINDAGLTGLGNGISSATAHFMNWGQKEANEWRVHPYIGDLVDLQHFTYNRVGLTHLSIDHGLIDCKNLTYLKIPPYRERPREAYYATPYYNYNNCAGGSLRAQIIPILRNCPRLVKLDISLTNIVSNRGGKLTITPTSKTKAALEYQQYSLNFELNGGKYNVNNMDLQFIKQQSAAPNYIEILYSK